jgi:transposase
VERFGDLDVGRLRDILDNGETAQLSNDARKRCEMLLFAAEERAKGTSVGDVTEEVRKRFGESGMTLRRWLKRFDPTDPHSLEERSRRPHTVRQSDVEEHVVAFIERYRRTFPNRGALFIREQLQMEHAIQLSVSTIWRVINRKGFYFADTPSHRAKRNDKDQPAAGGTCDNLTGASPTAPVILLLIAIAVVASFTAPSAFAAGASTSFRIDFDDIQTGTWQGDGDSLTVIGGATNMQKTGAGASFQIVPYAFLPSEPSDGVTSAPIAAESAGIEAGVGGRRGGVARAAEKIEDAYRKYMQRIGRGPDGVEVSRGPVELPAGTGTSIVRAREERLSGPVDEGGAYRDVPVEVLCAPYVSRAVAEATAHQRSEWVAPTEVHVTGPAVKKAEFTAARPGVGENEELHPSGFPCVAEVREPGASGWLRTVLWVVELLVAFAVGNLSGRRSGRRRRWRSHRFSSKVF